jgi:hypothetical protein
MHKAKDIAVNILTSVLAVVLFPLWVLPALALVVWWAAKGGKE